MKLFHIVLNVRVMTYSVELCEIPWSLFHNCAARVSYTVLYDSYCQLFTNGTGQRGRDTLGDKLLVF